MVFASFTAAGAPVAIVLRPCAPRACPHCHYFESGREAVLFCKSRGQFNFFRVEKEEVELFASRLPQNRALETFNAKDNLLKRLWRPAAWHAAVVGGCGIPAAGRRSFNAPVAPVHARRRRGDAAAARRNGGVLVLLRTSGAGGARVVLHRLVRRSLFGFVAGSLREVTHLKPVPSE
ncbi:hypothetical protein DIPPA_06929 [Diplonema papillatum]|nr:hypothetical protein DIPPA_06929 [Diplonema papillatum]